MSALDIIALSISDPWAASHGGTKRTRAFLSCLAALGHRVTCIFPAESAAPSPANLVSVASGEPALGERRSTGKLGAVKKQFLPMPTQFGARSAALERAVASHSEANLVVISSLAHLSFLDHFGKAAVWADFMDVWSEVARREALWRKGPARLTSEWQRRRLLNLESSLLNRSTLVTSAGWKDARMLQGRKPGVRWLPTPIWSGAVPEPPPRPGTHTAGFLANLHYWANQQAFRTIVEHWAPALESIGWSVLVAGRGTQAIDADANIKVIGPVAELAEFYEQVDVTLAPISGGGGLKHKMAESLLFGRAVVASEPAVEGFPPEFKDCFFVTSLSLPDLSFLSGGPPDINPQTARLLELFKEEVFCGEVQTLIAPSNTT